MKIEELHFDIPKEPIDEKNWDLEKWRKDFPIDYYKSMYILSLAQNDIEMAATFKAIYNVVRKHIPDVLYKYSSFSNNEHLNMLKLETLRDGKIFMSDIKDFNDPFDGKGFFYDPEKLSQIKRLKSCNGKIVDDFNTYIKATSLTENNVQSMPMWAHYGSNHTGFCVAYDMNKNTSLSSCTFPVQYTNERLDVTSLMKKQAQRISDEIDRNIAAGIKDIQLDDLSMIYMALLLCNLKHTSWSYEKEFRCTTGASAKGMPYIDANPKEIYIGMNCAHHHEQYLVEIATSWQIPVYKMVFSDLSDNYELIAKPYFP